MPRLWSATIAAHRSDVRDAILDAAGGLVAEHGLRAVTMSRIAETAGIGRATLYRYFPSVEAILLAWHERRITTHLDQLEEIRDHARDAADALEAVLRAYALTMHETHGRHDGELTAFLHRDEHVAGGRARLHALVRELVAAGSQERAVREDVPADELATYCLHAVSGAAHLPSRAAVERLVTVTLSGLHRP